ncbi:hypothetical protein PR048_021485 [Dryococelus australis]|uniref:Uncharacterized protein n=1 Tax=Dryococelus australis TaxID=614101 RepID=A0ABQ9GYB2_9NEOP|nr:hypothetical protein PR048_021485 [Dryococelus australis]
MCDLCAAAPPCKPGFRTSCRTVVMLGVDPNAGWNSCVMVAILRCTTLFNTPWSLAVKTILGCTRPGNSDLGVRGYGGVVVRQLASHQGEPGSIPGDVIPGFLHAGIVHDDAAGQLGFLWISHFPIPYIPAMLHTHLTSPSSLLKTSADIQEGGNSSQTVLKQLAPRRLTTLKVLKFLRLSHYAVSCCLQIIAIVDLVFHAVDDSSGPPSIPAIFSVIRVHFVLAFQGPVPVGTFSTTACWFASSSVRYPLQYNVEGSNLPNFTPTSRALMIPGIVSEVSFAWDGAEACSGGSRCSAPGRKVRVRESKRSGREAVVQLLRVCVFLDVADGKTPCWLARVACHVNHPVEKARGRNNDDFTLQKLRGCGVKPIKSSWDEFKELAGSRVYCTASSHLSHIDGSLPRRAGTEIVAKRGPKLYCTGSYLRNWAQDVHLYVEVRNGGEYSDANSRWRRALGQSIVRGDCSLLEFLRATVARVA